MDYTKNEIFLEIDMNLSEAKTLLGKVPKLERIASGFRFLEGPVWLEDEKRLIFGDISGNALYSWTESAGVSLFRENSYLANGNALTPSGELISCEHATSRVTRTNLSTGSYSIVVNSYQGKALNSPNDVIVKSDGSIYFTDPLPGRQPRVGIPRPPELSFKGIYKFDDKTAFLYLLDDTFLIPNGLCFSCDETQLFVNDSANGNILVFDVDPKGFLANKRIWGQVNGDGLGCADGMKYHPDGYIFCTGPGGIYLLSPEGKIHSRMKMPEVAANLVFADDYKTLYVTATSSLYRITLY